MKKVILVTIIITSTFISCQEIIEKTEAKIDSTQTEITKKIEAKVDSTANTIIDSTSSQIEKAAKANLEKAKEGVYQII